MDFKKPKYVIPILALPFLCLFFYVYSTFSSAPEITVEKQGINEEVGGISEQVKQRQLSDKLEAYRQRFKEADGQSAINAIEEQPSAPGSSVQIGEPKRPASTMQPRVFVGSDPPAIAYNKNNPRISAEDKAMASAIASLGKKREISNQAAPVRVAESDPMELFKKQMIYMDSVSKSGDPEYKASLLEKEKQIKLQQFQRERESKLHKVSKAAPGSNDFNTILPESNSLPISAMIEDSETGYLGSRVKIRLMEDIFIGQMRLNKGQMLFAEIFGFSAQRIKLQVSSVLLSGQILPVSLDIYDVDGLEGLYVPSSSFREFSKDLGASSMQGINIQGNSASAQEFLMSSLDKVFRSGASAISGAIRKNKAKIKYNTQVYLIDKRANP